MCILQVDGKSYNPFIQISDEISESFIGASNALYIGGFPKNIKRDYVRFKGCISSKLSMNSNV